MTEPHPEQLPDRAAAAALIAMGRRLHELRAKQGFEEGEFPFATFDEWVVDDWQASIAELQDPLLSRSVIRVFEADGFGDHLSATLLASALDPIVARSVADWAAGSEFGHESVLRATIRAYDLDPTDLADEWARDPSDPRYLPFREIADPTAGIDPRAGLVVDPGSATIGQISADSKGFVFDAAVYKQLGAAELYQVDPASGIITLGSTHYFLDPTNSQKIADGRPQNAFTTMNDLRGLLNPASWDDCPAIRPLFKSVTFDPPPPATANPAWKGDFREVVDLALGVATYGSLNPLVENHLHADFTTSAASDKYRLDFSLIFSKVLSVDEGHLQVSRITGHLANPNYFGRATAGGSVATGLLKFESIKKLKFVPPYRTPARATIVVWALGSRAFARSCN